MLFPSARDTVGVWIVVCNVVCMSMPGKLWTRKIAVIFQFRIIYLLTEMYL